MNKRNKTKDPIDKFWLGITLFPTSSASTAILTSTVRMISLSTVRQINCGSSKKAATVATLDDNSARARINPQPTIMTKTAKLIWHFSTHQAVNGSLCEVPTVSTHSSHFHSEQMATFRWLKKVRKFTFQRSESKFESYSATHKKFRKLPDKGKSTIRE